MSFQDYREYSRFKCHHAAWYQARASAKELLHPCIKCATCLTPDKKYDLSQCVPCMTFLEAITTSMSTTSLAHCTWLKWNRTIVKRWKKNRVALYVQPNVRLLLWTDPDLHTKYDCFLPPAPPTRSTSARGCGAS